MKVALIIPAAGAGRRYREGGAVRSKLDEDLGGRPVLQRTIENFTNHPECGAIIKWLIVAGPHEEEDLAEFRNRHADRIAVLGGRICRGGKEQRYESVAAALEFLGTFEGAGECTHIAVHDAARPCTPPELIERVFAAAGKHGAVIPAVEVSDTIRRVSDSGAAGDEEDDDPAARILGLACAKPTLRVVAETLDRRNLVRVQTPQIFRADLLKRAYGQSDMAGTDDAALVERLGVEVLVVDGDERNIKITRPGDLRLARAILGVHGPKERESHKKF